MSRPFSIFGLMMMVYPESSGLEGDDDDSDDDDGEASGNSSHSECPSPLCKSSDSSDDNRTEDLGDPIPFSLTPRHSLRVKGKRVRLANHALELVEEDQEFQKPFYTDMGMSDSLAGGEEPSPTYHRPGLQRFPALQKANAAANGSRGFIQHSSGQDLGSEAAATPAHASDHYVGHPESTLGAEPHTLHEEDSEDRESPSPQPTYDTLRKQNSRLVLENKMLRNGNHMLRSENVALREVFQKLTKNSTVLMEEDVVLREEYNELRQQCDRLRGENVVLKKDNAMVRRQFYIFQDSLKRQACMVSSLQDQLKTSQAEREREAREIQSFLQETECHLQLMTQRALDAEANVERLKQKVFILQGQLGTSKLENENQRAGLPGSSEPRVKLHQVKPPQAHNGHKWLPQAPRASGMLPAVAEVLESTRKLLKF